MEGDSRSHKVPLLQKYDIPLQNLSYEYVEQCTNVKELERIIRILRSGEEGCYPELVTAAEEKLRQLAPNSRILQVVEPVLHKESLSSEEWKKVENDLLTWENEMKVMDKGLEFEKKRFESIGNKDLPEVRKVRQPKGNFESKKVQINQKNDRIKSSDYSAWDKFDADKELLKMDIEEERRHEESEKQKKLMMRKATKEENKKVVEETVKKDTYSATEQQILAVQAKDRGNECYKTGDLNSAMNYYNISLKLHPTANTYNNRAMTYLKLQKYEEAVADCKKVLQLEPTNVKALHRRATAFQNMPEPALALALQDLTRLVQIEPNNKAAQLDLHNLRKKLNIEDNGRKFRMTIDEGDDKSSAAEKSEGKQPSKGGKVGMGLSFEKMFQSQSRGPGPGVVSVAYPEKLPLTYYGPSTSRFQCEPQSMTHRMLSGPTGSDFIACKCNSNMPRQNPLCQRCGELMCRPKPPRRPQSSAVKINHDMRNSILRDFDKPKKPGVVITEIVNEPENRDDVKCKKGSQAPTPPKSPEPDIKFVEPSIVKTPNANPTPVLEEKATPAMKTEDTKVAKDETNNTIAIVDNKNVIDTQVGAEETQESLPSTSSQPVTRKGKKNKKKDRKDEKERGERMEYIVAPRVPAKINQASKYISPTSTESKGKKEERQRDAGEEAMLKSFVANHIRDPPTAPAATTAPSQPRDHGDCRVQPSPFEFIKTWEALAKTDPTYQQRSEMLNGLQPEQLPKIVGTKLDSEMLKAVIHCLDQHLVQSNPPAAAAILSSLPRIPRYSTVCMFMDTSEKSLLERVLEATERKGHKLDEETRKSLLNIP